MPLAAKRAETPRRGQFAGLPTHRRPGGGTAATRPRASFGVAAIGTEENKMLVARPGGSGSFSQCFSRYR